MVSRKDANKARLKRHKRVRAKISGTAERPRLAVYRSNANISAQIQGVKDMMYENKIEALQNRVAELTTQGIVDRATAGVVRYPMNTMYAVPSPCFGGCPCPNM